MEKYLEFYLLCLKAGFGREEYDRQKKERCVAVPFRISEDLKLSHRVRSS